MCSTRATEEAEQRAYSAMLAAARALVRTENIDLAPSPPTRSSKEFRARFFDTQLFYDPFAAGEFAPVLFAACRETPRTGARGGAPAVEEAQLFVDAAHEC